MTQIDTSNPFAPVEEPASRSTLVLAQGLKSSPFPDRVKVHNLQSMQDVDSLLGMTGALDDARNNGIAILNLVDTTAEAPLGLGVVLNGLEVAKSTLVEDMTFCVLDGEFALQLTQTFTAQMPIWTDDTLGAYVSEAKPVISREQAAPADGDSVELEESISDEG